MSKTKLREFEARQQQVIAESALLPCEISYPLYQADVLNTGCQNISMDEHRLPLLRLSLSDLFSVVLCTSYLSIDCFRSTIYNLKSYLVCTNEEDRSVAVRFC